MHTAPLSHKRSSKQLWVAGAAVCVCVILIVVAGYLIVTGKTRRTNEPAVIVPVVTNVGTSTTITALVPRALDGVMVSSSVANLRPWAFTIDNQVDARPSSGLDQASVVFESPVEGGITRFLAIFDPKTASDVKIGAIRSARPYFVDWATAWHAVFGHVGGSPEALDKLARTPSSTVLDLNEMVVGAPAFWRDQNRVSPHQVFTTPARFTKTLGDVASSTVSFTSWRYTSDAVPTSTAAVGGFRVTYGGSYTVRWTYDGAKNAYRRIQAVKANSDTAIYATNVVVIKTDARILDEKGRLSLRTTSGGEAVLYRDGKKYIGRWSRPTGQTISFVGTDGNDLELRAGSTWIEVTTDDRVFAGLDGSGASTMP